MHVTLSIKQTKQYQQRTEFYYKVITINNVHTEALVETNKYVSHISVNIL